MSKDLIRTQYGLKPRHWSLKYGYEHEVPDVYPLRAYDGGEVSGFQAMLKIKKSDLDYACRGPYTGFKISIHLPMEMPQVTKRSMSLSLSRHMRISVKANVIRTSEILRKYKPEKRQCYFESERQLRFFKVYTQSNCELECLSNFTKIHCGCVKFSMPSNNFIQLN